MQFATISIAAYIIVLANTLKYLLSQYIHGSAKLQEPRVMWLHQVETQNSRVKVAVSKIKVRLLIQQEHYFKTNALAYKSLVTTKYNIVYKIIS